MSAISDGAPTELSAIVKRRPRCRRTQSADISVVSYPGRHATSTEPPPTLVGTAERTDGQAIPLGRSALPRTPRIS